MSNLIPGFTGYRPSAVEAGYVARQLLARRYTSIPRLSRPSAEDAAAIAELMNHALRVPGAFQLLATQHAQRPGAKFEATINDLKRHSGDVGQLIDKQTAAEATAVLADILPRAEALLKEPPPPHLANAFGKEDAIALAAARWFKHEYFTWIDPIKCPRCGGATKFAEVSEPNERERAGGARRVEVHKCDSGGCEGQRRFARYNTVKALMGSREGRCGEFAQLFYVFLLVLGLEARYVWNSEDHVWTEYFSPTAGHWVHVDSCEAEVGKPQLYDRGWGKQQRWCLAFGALGAEDVTRAYVDDWDACLARRMQQTEDGRGVTEERLKLILLTHTVQCRAHRGDAERAQLAGVDQQQAAWITDARRRNLEAELGGLKGQGRESGTEEWVQARGEGGDVQMEEPPEVIKEVAHEPNTTNEVPGEVKDGVRETVDEESEAAAAGSGTVTAVEEVKE